MTKKKKQEEEGEKETYVGIMHRKTSAKKNPENLHFIPCDYASLAIRIPYFFHVASSIARFQSKNNNNEMSARLNVRV